MHDLPLRNPLIAAIRAAWPGAALEVDGIPHMLDLTPQEIVAIEAASPAAGAYLEGIGKSDLAAMTEGEWMLFLETVIAAYLTKMAAQHAPFAVLRSNDDPCRPIEASEVPY